MAIKIKTNGNGVELNEILCGKEGWVLSVTGDKNTVTLTNKFTGASGTAPTTEVEVDGATYANIEELKDALGTVLFKGGGSGPGTEASWGDIDGNIEDQTDLVQYISDNSGGDSGIPDYEEGETYQKDEVVIYTINGYPNIYRSLQDNNIYAPDFVNPWAYFGDILEYPVYDDNTTYSTGDHVQFAVDMGLGSVVDVFIQALTDNPGNPAAVNPWVLLSNVTDYPEYDPDASYLTGDKVSFELDQGQGPEFILNILATANIDSPGNPSTLEGWDIVAVNESGLTWDANTPYAPYGGFYPTYVVYSDMYYTTTQPTIGNTPGGDDTGITHLWQVLGVSASPIQWDPNTTYEPYMSIYPLVSSVGNDLYVVDTSVTAVEPSATNDWQLIQNLRISDADSAKGLVYAENYSEQGKLDSLWLPDWGTVKDYVIENSPIISVVHNNLPSSLLDRRMTLGSTSPMSAIILGTNGLSDISAATRSVFIGDVAGQNATYASNAVFIGAYAGQSATNASSATFIGYQAGINAENAIAANFLGYMAGNNAITAKHANFIGYQTGLNATEANNSNFIGTHTGRHATNANHSNFIGLNAGTNATNAYNSNFIGRQAGMNAPEAYTSNFIGHGTGTNATGASLSNFIGMTAGQNATNAYNSNFLGLATGMLAIEANNSNFIGTNTGYGADNASYSNFIGYMAGNGADNADHSNFIGYMAGNGADNADYANFLGAEAGLHATNADNSNFIGYRAGRNASDAHHSNFIGYDAGEGAEQAYNGNFIGRQAGYQATGAYTSNFIGTQAGYAAVNATHANFLGNAAGRDATNGTQSNFLGQSAGQLATNASYSNFLGQLAGASATNADHSNFLGRYAGRNASDADHSVFIGYNAGNQAASASKSILIGMGAGHFRSTHTGSIGNNNIIIGNNISLPAAATNSINIGGILYGTNMADDPMPQGLVSLVPTVGGRIGICVVEPSKTFEVNGSAGYVNDESSSYTDRSFVDKAYVDSRIPDLSQLGTAAESNVEDFATAAQGTLASTAVQPATLDARLSATQRLAIDALVSPEEDYADMTEATAAIKSIIDALKAV